MPQKTCKDTLFVAKKTIFAVLSKQPYQNKKVLLETP
jgi:hypothetical protein